MAIERIKIPTESNMGATETPRQMVVPSGPAAHCFAARKAHRGNRLI